MTTHRRARRTGVLALGVLAVTAALAVLTLAACGSSSPAKTTSALGTVKHQECLQVGAVLSDGPDPDADPVGYAEAQVLPLRQLQLSETGLRHAVLELADAYQVYSTAPAAAGPADAVTVSKDEAAVNAICPGAAN